MLFSLLIFVIGFLCPQSIFSSEGFSFPFLCFRCVTYSIKFALHQLTFTKLLLYTYFVSRCLCSQCLHAIFPLLLSLLPFYASLIMFHLPLHVSNTPAHFSSSSIFHTQAYLFLFLALLLSTSLQHLDLHLLSLCLVLLTSSSSSLLY